MEEIRDLTSKLGEVHAKLSRFTGEKETQAIGSFESVMEMVQRVTELSRFIEFE